MNSILFHTDKHNYVADSFQKVIIIKILKLVLIDNICISLEFLMKTTTSGCMASRLTNVPMLSICILLLYCIFYD